MSGPLPYEVRRAGPADYPRVGRLTVDAYRGDGLLEAGDAYLDQLADAEGRARAAELWVAASGSTVLGSVTFCAHGSRFAEISRPDEGEFRMLGVHQAARRRGIAEALVLHCLERSRELGHRALVLSSLPSMTSAHRLYAKLGFEREPDRDWSPGPGIDLITFGRRVVQLEPGSGPGPRRPG